MNFLTKVLAISIIALVSVTVESSRVKRADCSQVHKDFKQCGTKAYQKYRKAVDKGKDPSDTKEDFEARKVCNYMIDAIENCGNQLIGECMAEEKVTEKKDKQLREILKKLKKNVDNWDTEKCPATKAHVERIRAAQGFAAPAPSGKQKEEQTNNSTAVTENPTGGAGSLAVPTVIILIAAAFV